MAKNKPTVVLNRGEARNQKIAIVVVALICIPIVALYFTFFRLAFLDPDTGALTLDNFQFLYTTMVDITAAVKYYLGNALGKCSLGYSLAYLAGSFLVGAATFKAFFHGGGADQGHPCVIVDDLGIDVFAGAEHVQPRTIGGACNLVADTQVSFLSSFIAVKFFHH